MLKRLYLRILIQPLSPQINRFDAIAGLKTVPPSTPYREEICDFVFGLARAGIRRQEIKKFANNAYPDET